MRPPGRKQSTVACFVREAVSHGSQERIESTPSAAMVRELTRAKNARRGKRHWNLTRVSSSRLENNVHGKRR